MKNFIVLSLAFSILILPAYCVEDIFVENTLDKSLKIKEPQKTSIQDEFVQNSLDKNLKIKSVNYKTISDDFAEKNKAKNFPIIRCGLVEEKLPQINADKRNIVKKTQVLVDISSQTPIKIAIAQNYSTKYFHLEEGDFIDFVTTEDVKIKNKIYPKGSLVKGRIENISLNKAMGVPSEVVVGNFVLDQIPLTGELSKTGANRSLWVYPCVIAGSWFFFAGLLFIPIRGGHAKINTTEVFTVYAN